ncbi:AMP-binding protein, partial [Streptomyces sp. NPDC001985]|uniref:AMP-binding protein n=1 Tax=Streptomyces sp. NPDC001985 TaxID=3154406 RepID=UPI0033247BB0
MPGGTLHHLFEDRVRSAPDRTAVITDRVRLSYGQLDERADRLARHLTGTVGLPPGALVAIRTRRAPDVLVAILAVLKAGGVYSVLAPERSEPPALAGARAVLAHRFHSGRIEGGAGRPLVLLDGHLADAGAPAARAPAPGGRPGGGGAGGGSGGAPGPP